MTLFTHTKNPLGFYKTTPKKFKFLFFLFINLILLSNITAQSTYYVGPWNPVDHPPVSGTPGWEIQDDNVTGLSTNDPFASWSQFVNLVDAVSGTPSPNITVNLFSDAYIESYDYDNEGTSDNGILGHNLGVTLNIESSANGMNILGSTDGCYTLLDNTANGTGNIFANVNGVDGLTVKGLYFLNNFKGAMDITNSTNILIEDCIFDNNDIGGVPVFRILSDIGAPANMQITFRNCSFINNNDTSTKMSIVKNSSGQDITIDFENCVWSCNTATSGGTAIKVENNSGSAGPTLSFTGCTFANNVTTGSQGGAVWFDGSESTSTFTGCNFISNSVSGGNGGGAIFIGSGEDVTITGSTFYSNSSTNSSADGGAIHSFAGSSNPANLNISNTVFDNNTVGDDGAAVELRYTSAIFDQLYLIDNQAGDGVITMGNSGASLTISNYTCVSNTAPDGCVYNRSATANDLGGSFSGTIVDLSGVAPDYACGAFCHSIVPATCLAIDRGASLCGDPSGGGSICGSTFQDDLDGIKELPGDDGVLINSYIILYDVDGNLIGREYTDSNGDYCFNNLPDGQYYVSMIPRPYNATPDYYNVTLQDATGDGTTDSDINQSTQTSHLITIDNSTTSTNSTDLADGHLNHTNVDGGFTQVITVSGTLFLDENLTDIYEIFESNIITAAGITISLYNETTMTTVDVVNTTVGLANTGATYAFLNVPPGTYTVTLDIADPDIPSNVDLGTPENITSIAVGLTVSVGGINFGFDPKVDIDEDDDGITGVMEIFFGDHDMDGTPDYSDPDFCLDNFDGVDGWDCATNGLPDPDADLDGDGVKNYLDEDFPTCGGIIAGVCSNFDHDGDGISNHLDLDADNDGIQDVIEAGGNDPDNDGLIGTGIPVDSDEDGLADDADPDGTSTTNTSGEFATTIPVGNLDEDGVPNFLDLDADNDGIVDIIEAGGADTNGDGQVDALSDPNMNGWHDALEGVGQPLPNTDGFGEPNWLDIDADDDGITDNVEGQSTGGFDMAGTDDGTGGYVAPTGMDDDNDGIDNAYDNDNTRFGGSGTDSDVTIGSPIAPHDFDGDGNPDYTDTNSDDDGASDYLEGHDFNQNGSVADDLTACTPTATHTVPQVDSDNDGLLDCYDNPTASPLVTMVGAGSGNCPLGGGCTPEDTDISAGDNDSEPDFRDMVTDLLPVELTHFSVKSDDCNAQLSWVTVFEENSKYFAIEKSESGGAFAQIARISAAGNSLETLEYSYTDKDTKPNTFYRLKIVDIDGSFDYSEKILFFDKNCGNVIQLIDIFPNPVNEKLHISLVSLDQQALSVNVHDVSGKIIMDNNVDIVKGNNDIVVDTGELAEGIYFLYVIDQSGRLTTQTIRFVKH